MGAPTSVYDPLGKFARRTAWLIPLTMILSAAILAVHPNVNHRAGAELYGFAAAPVIMVPIFLAARRAYEAVGPGWVYTRRSPVGKGKFIRFNQVVSIDVVVGRYGPPSLVVLNAAGTKIKFSKARLRLNGPSFGSDLASNVLDSRGTKSPAVQGFIAEFVGH